MFYRLLALLLLISFSAGSTHAQDADLNIVATTTQAADLVTILTADVDTVQITALMNAGVDPHLYQPTESDVAAMSRADLVVYNGLHLEGKFDEVFASLSERGVPIYALGQPVKDAGYIVGGFDLSDTLVDVDDPHFWFDPRNWELTALDLVETLATLDPANAETYRANGAAYAADLQALFDWSTAALNNVPEAQRDLVTSHDAFQYFGAAFGWRVNGIQGISTASEAGVGDIQATVDFVANSAVPVLFVESSIAPNTIQAVIAGVRAAGGEVRIGVRVLYSDAMGDPDGFGGTYTSMIASNVYTILQSFQCAGVDLTIPPYPEALEPQPPTDLLDVDCAA